MAPASSKIRHSRPTRQESTSVCGWEANHCLADREPRFSEPDARLKDSEKTGVDHLDEKDGCAPGRRIPWDPEKGARVTRSAFAPVREVVAERFLRMTSGTMKMLDIRHLPQRRLYPRGTVLAVS